MKKEITTQNPFILGYQAVCFYSLKDSDYPEENRFMETTALSLEQMIRKLEYLHKSQYLEDDSYFDVTPIEWGRISHKSHGGPLYGHFEATYAFGPKVTYYIYIKPLYKDSFGIPTDL
jgi:hypothetical protein